MNPPTYDVLGPAGEPASDNAPAAVRLPGLEGRTIGLLSNGQFRADRVLDTVAEIVRRRYPTARVIHWSEFPRIEAMGDVERRVAELTEVLKQRRPDAVVSSTGA